MNWTQAFARQASSDLAAREVLAAEPSLPACHSLHYLQMACEKLCKAAMIAAGADATEVQRSHAHIAKQPADHHFEFSALFEPAGITLLKILRQVAVELQR